MNPRYAFVFKLLGLLLLIVALALLFPSVMQFVDEAARELVYFWWLILLLLLAVWLIWGLSGKKK
jgi:type VI protein secretion system component VasK